jgi:hypothetical protein
MRFTNAVCFLEPSEAAYVADRVRDVRFVGSFGELEAAVTPASYVLVSVMLTNDLGRLALVVNARPDVVFHVLLKEGRWNKGNLKALKKNRNVRVVAGVEKAVKKLSRTLHQRIVRPPEKRLEPEETVLDVVLLKTYTVRTTLSDYDKLVEDADWEDVDPIAARLFSFKIDVVDEATSFVEKTYEDQRYVRLKNVLQKECRNYFGHLRRLREVITEDTVKRPRPSKYEEDFRL